MNFKTLHNGFALVEVIIALAMIALMLTSLLVLQAASFRRVAIGTMQVEHFYPAKALMTSVILHPLKKGETKTEKKDEKTSDTVIYQQHDIPRTSALGRFKGLYQKVSRTGWTVEGRERVQECIGYGFTPVEPEKK